MPARCCTSTTSRYLLPPTLNTWRLLPQMLAPANRFLMSFCVRHFAVSASSCQLRNGPRASAQPGRFQNFFRLLLAKTLIKTGISRFGRSVNERNTDAAGAWNAGTAVGCMIAGTTTSTRAAGAAVGDSLRNTLRCEIENSRGSRLVLRRTLIDRDRSRKTPTPTRSSPAACSKCRTRRD
jgi:hypothetical protein